MTNEEQFVKLIQLPQHGSKQQNEFKKFLKKIKKPIDKAVELW